MWDRGFIRNDVCSCGASFWECPVWQEILSEAFGDIGEPDPQRMVDVLRSSLRTKHLLLPPPWRRLGGRLAGMQEYSQILSQLYEAVSSVTQSRVIVDTSKVPAYAYILDNLANVELYVLHLVRDPRAPAYSLYRRKVQSESSGKLKSMGPRGLVYSSLLWDEHNLIIERLWKEKPEQYMRLHYEDFVASPKRAVQSVLRFLGEESSEVPFTGESEVLLSAGHVLAGNPNRFDNGIVTIKAYEEWRQKLSGPSKAFVDFITWPGLLRYGYPIWNRSKSRPSLLEADKG